MEPDFTFMTHFKSKFKLTVKTKQTHTQKKKLPVHSTFLVL